MSEDVEKAILDITFYAHSGKSAPESEAYLWTKKPGIYMADKHVLDKEVIKIAV